MNGSCAPVLYLSVGIAGSGKSKFADFMEVPLGAVEINADNIRKEFGDISSQEKNDLVWKKVDHLTTAHLAGGDSVFLSNTNLHWKGIKSLIEKYPYNKVVVYVMLDSYDPDLCFSRVKNDLENGKVRSDVPEDVIKQKQYNNFLKVVKCLKDNKSKFKKLFVCGVNRDFSIKNI